MNSLIQNRLTAAREDGMPIEFRCLNCRNTIIADESEAGEKTECEKCGFRVTVPQPIGGELTDRRLRAPDRQPSLSVRVAPETAADDGGSGSDSSIAVEKAEPPGHSRLEVPRVSDQRFFDLDKQPRQGFEFTVSFPEESMSKLDLETLARSAAQIRKTLLEHLDQEMVHFERGALVLMIHRCRATAEGLDVNLRLVGLVNDMEVSHYFYSLGDPTRHATALQFGGLGALIARSIDQLRWKYQRESTLGRFHKRMVKRAISELTQVLDETVDRPVSLWTRFRRHLGRHF